jgi:SARP family transcriptional regulator, regulator of embCAB operon
MNIGILGTVSVTVGRTFEVRASKVRGMLATLALEPGRAVAHEELIDELWSGRQLGNVRNALQAHATRLRRLLEAPGGPPGASPLRSMRNGYLLDIPRENVDGNRFLDLAAEGAAALYDRPQHAVEALQAGLQLWRGPALLDAGDGLRCRAAAAHFEERRLAVWEDLTSARLAIGQEGRAVAELRQLASQHPLRERFRELLMLGLYRSGRQSDALELFHHTRRLLDKELGLRPGPALQRLHTEILVQNPALTLPPAMWPGRWEAAESAPPARRAARPQAAAARPS